ncbi:hypothetical protein GCM10008922_30590 [Faecalicatena contorta]|nr:hypothetical protein CE91St64_05910 [Faecalicatena contorta]
MDEGDYCYFYTSKYVKRSRNLGITEAGLSYLLKKFKKMEKIGKMLFLWAPKYAKI